MAARSCSVILRGIARPWAVLPPRSPVVLRTLHASSSVLAKKRPSAKAPASRAEEEEEELDEETEFGDLFSADGVETNDSEPPSSTSATDKTASSPSRSPEEYSARQALRTSLLDYVFSTANTDPQDRRHRRLGEMRVGVLKKITQLSENDQLDELPNAVKAWRMIGMRVTVQTASQLIVKCLKAGRVDLALEFLENKEQYGLPLIPEQYLIRLHFVMLSPSYNPAGHFPLPTQTAQRKVTPRLALVRLRLLHRAVNWKHRPTPAPGSEDPASSDATADDQSIPSKISPNAQARLNAELQSLLKTLRLPHKSGTTPPSTDMGITEQARQLSGDKMAQEWKDAAAAVLERVKVLEAEAKDRSLGEGSSQPLEV